MNEVVTIDQSIVELQNTHKLCQMLMATPHYQKVGQEGIFAIVETAKSVGVEPLQALNGGMYFVRGKVEMSAMMMNTLIRQAGHSITKDKKSDDTICILHGKRRDTGDTWVESFSIDDAKAAGLLNNPTWRSYRKDMLFARALSRLARQLFPDVIKGCYVQGEIQLDNTPEAMPVHESDLGLSADFVRELADALEEFPDYQAQVDGYLKDQGLTLADLDHEAATRILSRVHKLREEFADAEEVCDEEAK